MDLGCYSLHSHARARPRSPAASPLGRRHRRRAGGHPGVDEWVDRANCIPVGRHRRSPGATWPATTTEMILRLIGSRRGGRHHRLRQPAHTTTGSSSPPRAAPAPNTSATPSSYTYQLEAFIGAVRDGAPYRTDADDAVATMSLIDECYRSLGLRPRPTYAALTKES